MLERYNPILNAIRDLSPTAHIAGGAVRDTLLERPIKDIDLFLDNSATDEAAKLMRKAGADRLAALRMALDLVRRGGTVSIVGVYGAMTDPMPMMTMFDKQVQLRMGQANVRRWVDDILPLLVDDDPLGVDTFATHHVPLSEASAAYSMFQTKSDGAIKVVFNP